jgi:caa(3)-type oxidase subunit IV
VSEAAVLAGTAHDEPHVNYIAKFVWLVALTTVEVGVAIWVEGVPKLALLTFLSVWKASIVLKYFMHLKTEGIGLKLAMLFPVLLMVILFTLFLVDSQYFHYNAL